MADRTQSRKASAGRRLLVGVGASAGVFLAAAAMATGSAFTAAPAHADFDDLLDPIIQPLLTSFTDAVSTVDPAAALDITSWTDSLLSSLNTSFDVASPTAESAAAVAAAAEPAASTGATLPLTVLEGTEPAVYATIDGGSTAVPLLVDTGSSGLVIPSTELGSNFFTQLEALYSLGSPTGISESGYSGGVEYLYLTYNNVPVDYTALGGGTFDTNGPVDIEIYSWNPSDFGSLFTNNAFQDFLGSNEVNGILGVGDNAAGPTTSPFINYDGVLVDIPHGQLLVGDYNTTGWVSTSGAPISNVFESINNGTPLAVSNNIDSGGVFGTIPSSLTGGSAVGPGETITVTNAAGQTLYSYTTSNTFDISDTSTPVLVSDSPTVISGTNIDSGVLPFLNHAVYLDYDTGTTGTTFFSPYIATP